MNTEMYFQFPDRKKLDAKIESGEFPFNQHLFWDTPIEQIDLRKNQRYVIERVLTGAVPAISINY